MWMLLAHCKCGDLGVSLNHSQGVLSHFCFPIRVYVGSADWWSTQMQ